MCSPPERFDTVIGTGTSLSSVISLCTSLPAMSFDPPGVVGITRSTLFSGFQACAEAEAIAPTPKQAANANAHHVLDFKRMKLLPFLLVTAGLRSALP